MVHIDDPATQRANLGFIKTAMRTPLLPRAREFALARRWREAADTTALHELARAYTRLVIAIAARYRSYGLPMGDLVQEGNVGLMQAAWRFEPERDVRFSTYAAWWIRSAMQEYVLRNWSIVRTGTTAAQKSLFFNLRRLRARIEEQSGAPLDDAGRRRIAATLGVALAEVEQMELRLGGADLSLNAPLGEGEDDRQDVIADGRPSPEQAAIGRRDGATRARWLAEALGELSPRERQIIDARRLREDGATLEELGRALGVSKERVRQLELRALLKLRQLLRHRAAGPPALRLEAGGAPRGGRKKALPDGWHRVPQGLHRKR
ncbi:MAG: RNA polymerase factor sigma-32 [Stellaceae bacterium]